MQSINQNIKWYQSKFDAFEQGLNGEKSTSLHSLRRNAMSKFVELGFPAMRQEEWRFTNISPIIKTAFQPVLRYDVNGVTKSDIQSYILENAIQLVFIDGMYSRELSDIGLLPAGITVGSMAEMLKNYPEMIQSHFNQLVRGEENAFTMLNTAFLWDGAFVSIAQDVILENPIQLLFIATDREQAYASQPRNLIIAGMNCQFAVIETYAGLGKNTYLTNAVTEIVLGENSVVEHNKFQVESITAYHMSTTRVMMKTASRYTSTVVSLGGSIVRNNITACFDAEGAECTLNGLSLGRGTQIIDNHTVIDHAKPHCNSHELFKSILDGESKGVFNGKVFVRKDAQKTDAKQTNKTLLLSDGATMNTKPQLEIFADDVKCTHGATIGQLDDEQLFYLRSRGIDLDGARDMLTSAFASDVVNRITIEPFRQHVERMIHDRLNTNHRVIQRA
jgi:Fe-S cluster assembly protein SufD